MKTVTKTFTAVGNSLESGIIINAVLAVVLGASMKHMWALINALQILTNIPNMGLVVPTNLQVCLTLIIQISSLNIIPPSVVDSVVNFIQGTAAEVGNQAGSTLPGFDKGHFVKNIGFIIVTFIGMVFVGTLVGLLYLLSEKA